MAAKLRAIVDSKDADLASLAGIAGGDPKTFYRGANFNDADLRGEDLRGFNLTAATFERTRVNQYTKVDEIFIDEVGLRRGRQLHIPFVNIVTCLLGLPEISFNIPSNEALGDLIEEAIFGGNAQRYITDTMMWSVSFKRANFQNVSKETVTLGAAGGFERKKRNLFMFQSKLRLLQESFGISANRNLLNDVITIDAQSGNSSFPDPHFEAPATMTRRTAETVAGIAERDKMTQADVCSAMLVAYAFSLRAAFNVQSVR